MTDFGRRIEPHKATHQDTGADEISVEGLAGDLAEDQDAAAHGLGGTKHIASLLALVNSKITDANLDDKTDSRTPTGHKTSHQSGGADALACTGLAGRVNYVDRGDPSGYDKAVGDFTTDGNWQDLDLALIVPAGAIAIHFKCTIQDGLTGQTLAFRENGNAQAISSQLVTTQVAAVNVSMNGLVSCDAGRVIEYRGSATTFTTINFVVTGWLI